MTALVIAVCVLLVVLAAAFANEGKRTFRRW